MTSADRRTATDPTGAGGPIPPDQPTGTPRVDILRESADLGREGGNALRLWLIGNGIPHGTGWTWPLRIDWPARTITYWPNGIEDSAEGSFTRPLKRVPLAPLWRTLADAGALWCANPAHTTWNGTVCQHRVNAQGEHTRYVEDHRLRSSRPSYYPAGPPDQHATTQATDEHDADGPLELLITTALQRAAPSCEHPDPGQPIYDHTRACAACGAAAVLELFHTADAIDLFRRRHVPTTIQRYAYAHPGQPGPQAHLETLTPEGWARTDQ